MMGVLGGFTGLLIIAFTGSFGIIGLLMGVTLIALSMDYSIGNE